MWAPPHVFSAGPRLRLVLSAFGLGLLMLLGAGLGCRREPAPEAPPPAAMARQEAPDPSANGCVPAAPASDLVPTERLGPLPSRYWIM